MNITKNLLVKLFSVFLLLASGSVFATYKSDIIQSCKAYQQGLDRNEVNACKLYIDGFIDSSLLFESAAVKAEAVLEKPTEQTSDYMKRAYQTRVTARSSLMQTKDTHEFCIPLEVDRKVVASQVAKSMNIDDLEHKNLKQVLFETLESDFPC